MMMIGESGGQNGGCKTVKNKNQRSAKKTTRNTTLSRASLSLLSFNLLLPFAFHAGKDVRHDHDRSRADYDDARVSSLPEREEGIFRFLASSRREREDRLLSIADGNDPPSRGRRRPCLLLLRLRRSLGPDPRRRRRGPPELPHRPVVLVHQGHHGCGPPGRRFGRARGRLLPREFSISSSIKKKKKKRSTKKKKKKKKTLFYPQRFFLISDL